MGHFNQQILTIVRSKLFVKMLLEFLPLGLFLLATDFYDIYVGSAVLGVATLVCMLVIWAIYRQLALMAIITGVTGLFAAGATVVLVDPMWVKLKPTIVSALFGTILVLVLGSKVQSLPVYLTPICGGMVLYITMTSLVPRMLKETNPVRSLTQIAIASVGVIIMVMLKIYE